MEVRQLCLQLCRVNERSCPSAPLEAFEGRDLDCSCCLDGICLGSYCDFFWTPNPYYHEMHQQLDRPPSNFFHREGPTGVANHSSRRVVP